MIAVPVQARRRPRSFGGFTLVEMLVVVAIMGMLMAIILPSLAYARERARRTKCMSNMKQVALALQNYINYDPKDRFPTWLTALVYTPSQRHPFLDKAEVLICPSDPSNGLQGGRPDDLYYPSGAGGGVIDQFPNADRDNPAGGTNELDGGINCSYLFEFNGEECEWFTDAWGNPGGWPADSLVQRVFNPDGDNTFSWYNVKMVQVKGSSDNEPNSPLDEPWRAYHGYVPVLRCFWHCSWTTIDDRDEILNLNYSWGTVVGHPKWEDDY